MMQEHIKSLSEETRLKIIEDYKEFEKNGVIGNCVLRKETNSYMETKSIPYHNIVIMMNEMASNCFRYYAERYIQENT
jgi:hypothetical protein